MKRLITVILIWALLIAGCASTKVINGRKVEPYGLMNKEKKEKCVEYKAHTGSIIWGIILIETIIAPIILFGKKLYEPVKKNEDCE